MAINLIHFSRMNAEFSFCEIIPLQKRETHRLLIIEQYNL